MTTEQFFEQLDTRIAKYDLLCHPFYKAWSAGELTREDLREYARDYYHHVEAFPLYLAELGIRLDESELRQAVLANMAEEKGMADASGEESTPHSELWLDFAEGMGARRNMRGHDPVPEIKELTSFFHRVASEGTPEEALAAFYAYESQVPRVAKEKARGLREMYGADERVTSLLHPAYYGGCLSLAGLASAVGETAEVESADGGAGAGCGRECCEGPVARAGWNRDAADAEGGGVDGDLQN